ncbi:MAG: hypothetical protein E7299_04630 [Lachnospiraceae bacterium]|nr:hypothetical protein [Lachnospiraceae bacterium]
MEAKESEMGRVFWGYFHSIMVLVLLAIWVITEIVESGKEIGDTLKNSESKSKRSTGETIMFLVILFTIILAVIWLFLNVLQNNQTVAIWFVGIYGVVYVYIAVKQIIKMIFVPENRAFSVSDIKDFIYTYMVWWLMVIAVNSSQPVVDMLNKIILAHKDILKVGMQLLWFYFNFLFALGGLYILLYYLWIIGKKLAIKFSFVGGKLRKLIGRIYNSWQQGEKYTGLRSFELWQGNKKGIIYKILMTIPLLLFDIWRVVYLLIKILIRMTFAVVLVSICDPIRGLYKYIRKLWNRHKNNEWMYVLAQAAGLCSYVIVFLIIQYGEYEEVTKTVYEFVGTIVLIPYFLGKIVSIKKNLKETEIEESRKEDKEIVIPDNMTYNEDGEGVINGKTIRQLEYEAMQYAANNPQVVKLNNKELREELHRIRREGFREKAGRFVENYIEIVVGVCISVCLICLYFVFRNENAEENVGLIGSIIGAEGTIISVLLTIAFTKRSNKKALGASVLPYISIEKEKEPVEGAYAFEYFKAKEEKYDFSGWKPFDFGTIQNDKIKMVRNGMAYLRIENIGIGPAIHLKMKIENFSSVYLPIDYLRPDDEIYVILNFNNPDQSYKTDIIFEYETIRGDKHTQRFHANITWHLDRTNFTLFV